jgi:hypothetical protein
MMIVGLKRIDLFQIMTFILSLMIDIRYKKHIFQRINKFFVRNRVAFRTPNERQLSREQIHTMNAYNSMYGDKNRSEIENTANWKPVKNTTKGSPKSSYVRSSTD